MSYYIFTYLNIGEREMLQQNKVSYKQVGY